MRRRLTEQQADELEAGKAVVLTFEQLQHVKQFAPEGFSAQAEHTASGNYLTRLIHVDEPDEVQVEIENNWRELEIEERISCAQDHPQFAIHHPEGHTRIRTVKARWKA